MPEIKQKQWFSVHIEGIAPVIVEYRIFAEDEEQAMQMVEQGRGQLDGRPHIELRHMQKRKVSIKNMLTGFVKWVRNF